MMERTLVYSSKVRTPKRFSRFSWARDYCLLVTHNLHTHVYTLIKSREIGTPGPVLGVNGCTSVTRTDVLVTNNTDLGSIVPLSPFSTPSSLFVPLKTSWEKSHFPKVGIRPLFGLGTPQNSPPLGRGGVESPKSPVRRVRW